MLRNLHGFHFGTDLDYIIPTAGVKADVAA
jgi:hypothetical protein